MTAARKLSAARPPAIGEDDPLWQKFITAPFDPNPAPEHETQALAAAGVFVGVGGAKVSAQIARRAAAESKAKRSSR